MDERRVADYFVVAGMPAHPELMEVEVAQENNPLSKAPITDLAVIFPPKEEPPEGYTLLESTPTGKSIHNNCLLSFLLTNQCCLRNTCRLEPWQLSQSASFLVLQKRV